MKPDPVEHQSIYENGHQDWQPGITCDKCEGFRLSNELRFPERKGDRRLDPVAIGVHSTNPKVEEFWHTGDPSVFAQPGALDYRPDR